MDERNSTTRTGPWPAVPRVDTARAGALLASLAAHALLLALGLHEGARPSAAGAGHSGAALSVRLYGGGAAAVQAAGAAERPAPSGANTAKANAAGMQAGRHGHHGSDLVEPAPRPRQAAAVRAGPPPPPHGRATAHAFDAVTSTATAQPATAPIALPATEAAVGGDAGPAAGTDAGAEASGRESASAGQMAAASAPSPEVTTPSLPAPATAAAPLAAATFAGLFAPIIAKPMGRGGWSRPASGGQPPPAAAEVQAPREPSLLALRLSVLARLNDLAGRLAQSGQKLQCDIAVDGQRRVAEVQCLDPTDQGSPWVAMQGLLVAGTVTQPEASLCFRLNGAQASSGPCALPGKDEPAPGGP